ncbi:DUF2087 domain-containing protein [Niallia endozanthoxylica]|uniref:DUF2087 domain-containing protein n=1 Tax=Niallia endozanthoxylica TaxID=2036016 RepID=A0A5J5HMH4_9BACI|nr:DUF2087 domain-containing protein [Niallia endozanthoxylica]KAA9021770.1 DUF2087 domain-containing protein [Niallia endozanthoxylica]
MEISEFFWETTLEELKQGYVEKNNAYVCLLCGMKIEKGIIYPYENMFYEAERFVRIHIERTHQSVFEYLIEMDKKLTGLTNHQKSLLQLFYQGKSDTEVKEELGIGSATTIRHHRFSLKEKERQAKTFLAIMELLKEKDQYAPAFVPVHKTATMVDNRYNVTKEEQEKILSKYFISRNLIKFPPKEKQRMIVLREIAKQLEQDHIYDEKELNESLKGIYEDYVLIRRYLIEYGLLDRKKDGSQYWLIK